MNGDHIQTLGHTDLNLSEKEQVFNVQCGVEPLLHVAVASGEGSYFWRTSAVCTYKISASSGYT